MAPIKAFLGVRSRGLGLGMNLGFLEEWDCCEIGITENLGVVL